VTDANDRQRLSAEQIALMHSVLTNKPSSIRNIAGRVERHEVISQTDTDTLTNVLIDAMSDEGSDPDGHLNDLGLKLDDVIGIVYQASEDFFRWLPSEAIAGHWRSRPASPRPGQFGDRLATLRKAGHRLSCCHAR